MQPLATFAEDLGRLAAPIAGGATFGALFGFLLGALAQAWVGGGRVVPIDRWVMWGAGLGGFVGFVALAYDGG